jgi:hypothetical protein
MKHPLPSGSLLLTGIVWATTLAPSARVAGQGGTQEAGPWQAGRCYRVFSDDRQALNTFKVVEAPARQWIRVQADPAAPQVPGATPQAPLWVNADAVFAVQEWTCWR